MKSLFHLLWSDLIANPQGNGRVRPARTSELALPYRIAAFSLLEGMRNNDPEVARFWNYDSEAWNALVAGRLLQMNSTEETSLPTLFHTLRNMNRRDGSPIPIHAAYELPLLYPNADRPPDFNALWIELLQFLTAIQGSERILDQMFDSLPKAIPYAERWEMRSRLYLPIELWNWIEAMALAARGRSSSELEFHRERAQVHLENHFYASPIVLLDDFQSERVDVSLQDRQSLDFPCAIQRNLPPRPSALPFTNPRYPELIVRIAQISAEPNWKSLPERFPNYSRAEILNIRRQICSAFEPTTREIWHLIIFPEVTLPPNERKFFERLVRQTKKAALIGCLWRQIPNSLSQPVSGAVTRYLVNEALLSIPLPERSRRVTTVRSFLVRKPLPTHVEEAFVRRLSEIRGIERLYRLLPGRRVHRFVHRDWGDFTVAICSDLIDPVPWASLRGEILHLLMCSYNKDVNLFEALTWVRAYENCVNVVAVNCGACGGSFAWSPRTGENKELAKLRGARLDLLAKINLPVSELLNWQRTGVQASVDVARSEWMATSPSKKSPKPPLKAPPPGFISRR
jgi:hypothetical protein